MLICDHSLTCNVEIVVLYKIGPWLFDHTRSLLIADGLEKELDPLSHKLLSFFIEQNQRIVPRDELVEQVWQRSFVDDNAINRAISELRKQLRHVACEKPLIKTHYRKGYSLTVEVSTVAKPKTKPEAEPHSGQLAQLENSFTTEKPQPLSLVHAHRDQDTVELCDSVVTVSKVDATEDHHVIRINKHFLAVGFAIIFGLVWVLITFSLAENHDNKPDNISHARGVKVESATWNVGSEFNPLVSFDQEYFAFGHSINNTNTTFIKHLKNQEQKELTHQGMEVLPLSWQLRKHALLTVLQDDEQQTCHYGLFDLSHFPQIPTPKIIARCNVVLRKSAQLSLDANTLYYIDFDLEHEGAGIYQFNIAKQKTSVLLAPTEVGTGVEKIKMSPDGHYLAYTRSNTAATSQLYVLNLMTNENILLHPFENRSFASAFDWSADSQKVILIEADKLLRIDIATKEKAITTFSDGYQTPQDLAVLQEKEIFVVPKVESQLALVKVNNLFNENIPIFKAIQQSDKQSYEPIVDSANIKNIFFASNRLGGHQIWVFNQGSLKQLSFIKNSTARLSALKLSVNSKMLLFTQNNQVHLLNLFNNTVSVITEIPNNVDSYAWSINNSIIFSGEEDKIWELNLANKQRQLLLDHGGDALIGDGRGNVYYFKNDYLVGLDGISKQKLPISSVNIRSSVLTKNYLYVTNQTTLYRIDRTTHEVKQSELSFVAESFSVLPNDSAVILTQTLRNDSQVKRITWL